MVQHPGMDKHQMFLPVVDKAFQELCVSHQIIEKSPEQACAQDISQADVLFSQCSLRLRLNGSFCIMDLTGQVRRCSPAYRRRIIAPVFSFNPIPTLGILGREIRFSSAQLAVPKNDLDHRPLIPKSKPCCSAVSLHFDSPEIQVSKDCYPARRAEHRIDCIAPPAPFPATMTPDRTPWKAGIRGRSTDHINADSSISIRNIDGSQILRYQFQMIRIGSVCTAG
jgi:hypothetical protein